MPVLFACLSMTCAASNDLLFKRRARDGAPPARHLLAVAVVWTAFFAWPAIAPGGAWSDAALWWGAVSGTLGIIANILLLESMRGCEVGTAATIYRLNLVPATLLAVVALGEAMTPTRAVAISVAIGAVALLAGARPVGAARFIALALAACLARAGMALAYKQGLGEGAEACRLLVMNGLAWIVGAVAYGLILSARGGVGGLTGWRRGDVLWGLASGLLLSGNVLFLALALQGAPLSQVLPISQMGFVIAAIGGCLLFGEAVTLRKGAAVLLGIAAILLLAQP